MSAVVVLAPIAIAAWPAVAAAVTAAVAGSGFRVADEAVPESRRKAATTVDLELDNIEVVEQSIGDGGEIAVEGRGVRVVFGRDPTGSFRTCVEGERDASELRAIGTELAGKVIQQYVYQRLHQQLEERGFVIISERQEGDQAIRLHVRRWES